MIYGSGGIQKVIDYINWEVGYYVSWQERACMVETYKQGPVYQVLKTCLPQCPVFVNTSATNVRCCMADGCNDFFTTPNGK